MQLFCLVALLLITPLVFAAENPVNYAGTTTGSASWAPPVFNSTGGCTVGANRSPYVVFNTTFTTAGVHEVAAMAENLFKPNLAVYIYTAFSAASPCAGNFVTRLLIKQFSLDGGPVIDDFINFNAGTVYYFVVSALPSVTNSSGIFAVNILPAVVYGRTNATSPTWPSAYSGSSGQCLTSGGANPYATYVWNQTTTGFFDLISMFANTSITFQYTYVTVYNGSITPGSLATPCNGTATGATFLAGQYQSGNGALLAYLQLIAGRTYTAVVSGDNPPEWGPWGLQIIPTRVRFFFNSSYTQPSRNTLPCSASSFSPNAWDSSVFTATQRAYLVDTAEPPSPFTYIDTYSFLYQGNNLGNGANGIAPQTCPSGAPLVIGGDTGDVTPVFVLTTVGQNYTVVVSTYSASTAAYPAAYVLYTFTGTPIGVLPSTTSGSSTGGATSGGLSTGGGSTTNATASGQTSTTSSASSVVASFGLVCAVVAALL